MRQRIQEMLGYLAAEAGNSRRDDEIVLIALPAPLGPPEVLAEVAGTEPVFVWKAPAGRTVAGCGVCEEVRLEGARRFGDLRTWTEALWSRLRTVAFPGCPPATAHLLGGLAFRVGRSSEPPWESFGDGRFFLPRWCYVREANQACLLAAVRGMCCGKDRERLLREFGAISAALRRSDRIPSAPASIGILREMSPEQWSTLVESIRSGIRQGRYRKVVLARRGEAQLHGPLDLVSVISRLDAIHGDTFRFALRIDKTLFLGATPERLVGKEGCSLVADALAGSATVPVSRADEDCDARALGLIADPKERAEHAFVVDAMRRKLEALCEEISCPASPRVLRLRHVMHMHTPIRGRLRRPLHVLDLVEALHPTPAVGGVPTEAAVQWITENEPVSRGWYAGPIGWFDRRGDGEFAVALRCGVFRDGKAYLYAGAGIVAQSDPDAEYEETTVKQRALFSVLGDGP